ncbi:hypothetical protein BCO26_1906 [Heyndrickxia coagulans 2-6]|nr:hypothetical protein BCO26_1906 [Heyndrickxia coagulans 2-6]
MERAPGADTGEFFTRHFLYGRKNMRQAFGRVSRHSVTRFVITARPR